LVADPTVLAAAVFGEVEVAQAVALLQDRALCAPHLVDYELAKVGLKKLRRGHLAESEVAASLDDFLGMTNERHAIDLAAVPRLAQRHRLTACDAACLWLAERLEAPLATFDAELAQAAHRHLNANGNDDAPA
jgi:predicted nucleic acid-binding protein